MKKKFATYTFLVIAFNLLSETAFGQDTIRGNSVCTTIDRYKLDNIMIVDLLNTAAEQGEIIRLNDREIITYQMEIKNWERISSVLSDSVTYYKGETSKKHRKLLRTRKIALGGVIVALLVGVVLH